MKHMRKENRMVRVDNETAPRLAKEGWQYASKDEYRRWLERRREHLQGGTDG